ncbi:pantoate--beta-alanine ligase [Alicyclobacillus pomorum]|jgi:pantoate--beta-alanine ligase|uniref:pantoate--beta-alanine ligase n=1 Tax=Alicyclobacillus pomorum TaxID=204470 RepID=UPI0003F75C5A|nr:pantoate--beta-alanine ligase [Alicyclobacillus pomorum]
MIQIHHIHELRKHLNEERRAGKRIGLVPTMGYLHEGHMALVDAARKDNDVVVASVFVNPLQFGPNEDFANYPRDLQHDAELLAAHGCDILFAPSVEEMYPKPMVTQVEVPALSTQLCGKTRPGHFRGVATVVSKLFHIVQPDRAYFGQKDGQQVAVIRRMVEDLNFPIQIVAVPIVREADGLAKSSRNVYLTQEERPHATVLYRALQHGKSLLEKGERSPSVVASAMAEVVSAEPGVRLDYAEAVSLDTLEAPERLSGPTMLAIAAYVGKARLIDNFQLDVRSDGVRTL